MPKSQRSLNHAGTHSSRISTHCGRLTRTCLVLTLCLFAAAVPATGQQQNSPYVYGTTLQAGDDTRPHTNYGRWQVWLYQDGERIPQYAPALQYSRWGLLEGGSAESVTKQLRDAQRFVEAYVNFFGRDTWGRHSFFNPLGPIPVTDHSAENEPTTLGVRYQLDELRYRVNRLIADAQPSLENNKCEGPSSRYKEYFDQIRDALQQVSTLYSQLARPRHDISFISREIARTGKVVREAANNLERVTASLPSVRLPASSAWMLHAEKAGSDGTIQVEVKETDRRSQFGRLGRAVTAV